MADNVTLPGTGEIIGADEISGAKNQRFQFGRPTVALLDSAQINAALSGDNTLLAGTGGQTIRLFKGWLVPAAAVSLKFKDGASVDFHPAILLQAGACWFFDFDGEPWFVTSTGNGLILNLSAAVQVSGRFHYKKS